jgi:signal transduction histidine kinase
LSLPEHRRLSFARYDLYETRCVVLHEFIGANRGEIIERCRATAASRLVTPLTGAPMDHGVPLFLDQLASALQLGSAASAEIGLSASRHGHDLLRQGFSLSQVVHDYGDVCQAITELAVESSAPISTEDFRTLNRCLDDAIAAAVTEYGRERNRSDVASESARGNERLGFFAHEMRNLINTAVMAFEVLKTGNVGVAGSTGTVLHRSLMQSRALIVRSLAEVRLTQGIQNREPIEISPFIEDVGAGAALHAEAQGVQLVVTPLAGTVMVHADRQILMSVVGNLVQNALKFTRPRTTVTIRVGASAERVLIEVEDHCGGFPGESADELFRPFEQRATDRSGLGLGLAFSRWGAEANGGRVYARNLPGTGCVFTVDLPRLPVIAVRPA